MIAATVFYYDIKGVNVPFDDHIGADKFSFLPFSLVNSSAEAIDSLARQ